MDIDCKNLERIGQTACFYLPRSKLPLAQPLCHEFFLAHYNAYTFEDSNIQGYWRRHPDSPIFEDANVKYVVSFDGDYRISSFVLFLVHLCNVIREECIYLTIGNECWLVWPEERT